MEEKLLNFAYKKETSKIIKVVGVGGGGGNAVTHMYKEGIHDVTFLLCNTDVQALENSEVPNKLVLGHSITKGLGAGSKPEKARMAAEESTADIQAVLNDGTKMAFITAGMGGGTGTGSGPVIAKIAKEMGILTVGIVTIPFRFEGKHKIKQALDGVEQMSKNVDALLVINNENLTKLYPELNLLNAFKKADDTLRTAAKSISDLITIKGYINVDFADVEATVKDGGVALINNGYGEGPNRLDTAIEDAIISPLFNNGDIFNAKRILLNLSCSTIDDEQGKMIETNALSAFIKRFGKEPNVIFGLSFDDSLGDKMKITLLATGFGVDDIPEMAEKHAREMSEEEIKIIEEKEKEEERERSLIEKYYGENDGTPNGSNNKFVIFDENELDNDDFITFVEENAPLSREKHSVRQARRNPEKVISGISGKTENATHAGTIKITQTPQEEETRPDSPYTPRNKRGGARFN